MLLFSPIQDCLDKSICCFYSPVKSRGPKNDKKCKCLIFFQLFNKLKPKSILIGLSHTTNHPSILIYKLMPSSEAKMIINRKICAKSNINTEITRDFAHAFNTHKINN